MTTVVATLLNWANPRRSAFALLITLLSLILQATSRADIVLDITSSTTVAGNSGSFDILLTNTGTSSQAFDGFNISISVWSSTGVLFNSASYDATSSPNPPSYIFDGNSFNQSQDPHQGLTLGQSLPNTTINPNDLANSGTVSVGAGKSVLLAAINYSVSPGSVAGPVTVTFDTATSFTNGLDGSSNPIFVDYSANNGTISVSAASVPEPSTLAMLSMAAMGLSLGTWCKRRKRGPKPEQSTAETRVVR